MKALFKILPFFLTGVIILITNLVYVIKTLYHYSDMTPFDIAKVVVLIGSPILFIYVLSLYSMKKVFEQMYMSSFRFMSTRISEYISTHYNEKETNIDEVVNAWINDLSTPFKYVIQRLVDAISIQQIVNEAQEKFTIETQPVKTFRIRLIVNHVVVKINDVVSDYFNTTLLALVMLTITLINIIIYYL